MKQTLEFFPRFVNPDLSEKQKITFKDFCDKYLAKKQETVTYSDMWNYASATHICDIKRNETHAEIMRIMWEIFMKKDSDHSNVFYNLIPRDVTRKMAEGIFKILIKKNWI